ncbi:Ig-like domain-containing protein [Vibrio scophthalmi]|uniref:Ig-like domain-containing protein n=1 Tax=Vibrio scophthalmi TaxID=45658 RepID=UPI001E55A102|nr:cadherin-like domain-containing protein [Vibrio scophthalmi]
MSLVDGSTNGDSDYTTTQVTVTYHTNGVEVSEILDVNNGSFTFELPANNDGFTVSAATLDDQHNPIFEGDEHFELIVSTESQLDVKSGQATIQDYQDNPPQSEDFEVNVGSSGKTQVIFDTANTPIDDGRNPDSDHISDRENDADNNADLKIVITELPENGTLYYKEGDEFFEITAEHLYSGEGDQNYTQFDSNSIHYQADTNSEGFSLGINNQQDSNPLGQPDKGASSQDFYNWGEKVDNTTRELKLSDGETITIRSEGGKLTQYSGDANAQHVGHGIAVGGGKGINEGEKLIVEFESRPADSITLGLDGLGGYFEQGLGSSKESSVVITVNFVGGSQIFEFQKDSSGSDELFHSITIPSADFPLPEGTEIESVELSTSGPGNWELRSLETSSSDSFDYKVVDSDGNFSEESTVTLNESNNAPTANDDPTNFVVQLGSFNTENNLLWSDDGATISTSANDDKSFDPTTLKQGVSDDLNGGPAGQIQYNRETGESEQFIINLDKPATEFSFTVSNLFKNEGGTGNHEQGKWVAYLNGVAVASDTFTANDGNHQGQFDVTLGDDENPIAFDEIIFEAQDFVDIPARGNDASDYFVTGFEASSDGAYAVNQGGVLEIPISELLSNDSDIDNDTIRITYVHGETQGEAYIKDGVIYFELNETFVGNTTFEYQITDDKDGFDSATVNVIVNPAPNDAIVNEVQLLSNSVEEGNDLAFKVTLDASALKETTLDIDFGLLGDKAGESDVDLSDLTFTNGVTYDQASGQITVPVGVKDFTVLVPTLNDSEVESTEIYSISVGGVAESGHILDNDDKAPNNTPPKAISIEFDTVGGSQEISFTELVSDTEDDKDSSKYVELRIESEPLFGKIYSLNEDGSRTELSIGDEISESTRIHYVIDPETLSQEGTLDNAILNDSFTYKAIDSEGLESTIESITLSSDNINISSNPEAIDHVRVNHYGNSAEKVLWSAGATHTSPAIDNKPLEGHKEGLFVDVGEGGIRFISALVMIRFTLVIAMPLWTNIRIKNQALQRHNVNLLTNTLPVLMVSIWKHRMIVLKIKIHLITQ